MLVENYVLINGIEIKKHKKKKNEKKIVENLYSRDQDARIRLCENLCFEM